MLQTGSFTAFDAVRFADRELEVLILVYKLFLFLYRYAALSQFAAMLYSSGEWPSTLGDGWCDAAAEMPTGS